MAHDPWRAGEGADPGKPAPGSEAADTIYLGGGTPSLLEPAALAELLAALGRRLDLPSRPWLALEANPEDATAERLAAWRRLGIDFLSFGVQSFDDDALAFLGRRHDGAEARRAVEAALAAGFPTVSLDLIYGLPGQSAEAWRAQLDLAAGLGPQHLSCYQLTVEPGTAFGVRRRRGQLSELPGEAQAELFRLTHERLAELGFAAYEVSNFAASPAHRSRHNRKYWSAAPYLGLGPSAHSFDGSRRWWNRRGLAQWQREVAAGRRPVAGEERLTAEQRALEELMLALRTPDGVGLAGFEQRHGVDLVAANAALCERLSTRGLLRIDGGRLWPTLAGLTVADGLAAEFELAAAGSAPMPRTA